MDLEINVLTGFEHLTRGLITEHENIIIHYVSDPRKGVARFDMGHILNIFEEYQVSTHYIIGRNGVINQMIHPDKKAWHAGKSLYKGTSNLNKNSIGIELVGNDDKEFEPPQYVALAALCSKLCIDYGIATKNIKGHQVVSDSKVRSDPKPDPGRMFDWIKFGYLLTKEIIESGSVYNNGEEHF
jgi:N-acetyl-anhydromuramyl-L-alanine amidase AmpD